MIPRRTSSGPFDRIIHSKANYRIALVGDVLATLPFLGVAAICFSGSPFVAGALILSGLLLWGFLEYAVHRWLLHGPPTTARRGHLSHHADGQAYISAPLFTTMATAWTAWALFVPVLSAGRAALLMFGVYVGYNYYALLHHVEHHRPNDLARFSYGRRLVERHSLHHRRPIVNYGVTTSVWDRLLGTFDDTGTENLTFIESHGIPRDSACAREVRTPSTNVSPLR